MKSARSRSPWSKCCYAAPPVLVFDDAGDLLRAWGGTGAGYEWPETEHGIFIDDNDFVWTARQRQQGFADSRVPNTMKHVCVAARIGEGKAPGEGNSHSIAKTSNAAIADSGCNPSGWHEFWPMALSKALA